jgi:hypothetical protein
MSCAVVVELAHAYTDSKTPSAILETLNVTYHDLGLEMQCVRKSDHVASRKSGKGRENKKACMARGAQEEQGCRIA